jgi:MFS superfamily sulfate permease-like transporter
MGMRRRSAKPLSNGRRTCSESSRGLRQWCRSLIERGYRIEWLPRDLVAGLMLAAIAILGQIATARLAGMPPETGLYAFAAGSFAFAAFGANRFMSVAADSTIAPRA